MPEAKYPKTIRVTREAHDVIRKVAFDRRDDISRLVSYLILREDWDTWMDSDTAADINEGLEKV